MNLKVFFPEVYNLTPSLTIMHKKLVFFIIVKMQVSAIWLVETAGIFQIFWIATLQISMECETQESEAGYQDIQNIWIYTNLKHAYVSIG